MLPLTDSDYLVRKARYDALIEEAERANFLKSIRQQQATPEAGWLYRLGSWLIEGGQRLQRYDAPRPRKLA